jgi:fatty-acid desaturase
MYKKISSHIFKLTLPLHLLFAGGIALCIYQNQFSWNYLLITLASWILISGYGISIGFHRLLSHRSFKTHPLVEKILSLLGCFGAQGSPIFWVSVHQGSHHTKCDTDQDLHSPIRGFWHSYMGWQIFLVKTDIPFKAGFHLYKDPFQKFLHSHYYKLIWFTTLALTLVNPAWSFYGLIAPMVISVHQENIINSFCHTPRFGYRNFNTSDQSVNNILLGLLFFGQGWHNNHHAHPKAPTFSHRWFEIDLTRPMIALIRK